MRRCHEATHVGRDKCKGPLLSAGFDGSSAVNEPHKPTEGSQGCGGGRGERLGDRAMGASAQPPFVPLAQ